ncbi:hypothetical protein AB5I41_01595 [Sphingomonas sp. MMS24-JH45]
MAGPHFATIAIVTTDAVLKKPHADWLDADHPTLAQKFGLHTGQRAGRHWLAAPYVEQGRTVEIASCRRSEDRAYAMDDDAPLTLWNHDVLLDESLADQPLIVTEGEWNGSDYGRQAPGGLVPNGAPGSTSDEALTEGQALPVVLAV